ncbi:hypothetical protein BC829DRAFT_386053 [Chytridium lagenaria]|nr:hypothetical protein BC829DRAFT_386053 [Chytridium lagenaria]
MALSERSVSTSNSDQDNLETPTQETVCAFSDKLTARQFASLTRMDVQLWDDEEEEEDSAVLAPPPPLTDDTTLCSSSQMDSDTESCTSLMETLSTSLSSSMPSTTSNSTVSSATSSISSTCSRGSGPRLDMSIFIPPSSSPSTHSPQLFTGSLPRRVSSTDAPLPSSPVPFIRSHVRTPSAPNFPISPQPPVQSSPNLSPAVLLANWKPLALTPATSSSAGHSHIALGINTSIASLASPSTSILPPLLPSPRPPSPLTHLPSSTSLSSTSTSSSSSSISPTSPPPRQLGGSLDRVTTITKKGRFTVVKEPSSHYYSHVRRVSVSSRFVIEKARADTCDSGVDMA